MQQVNATTTNSRKTALFAYENAHGETAFFTHAELVALRTAYVKRFPDQREDVYDDETLFDPKANSDLRQEMANWQDEK